MLDMFKNAMRVQKLTNAKMTTIAMTTTNVSYSKV